MHRLTLSSLRCPPNSSKRHQKVQKIGFNLEMTKKNRWFFRVEKKEKEKLYKPNTGYIAEEDAEFDKKDAAAPAEQMKIVIRG